MPVTLVARGGGPHNVRDAHVTGQPETRIPQTKRLRTTLLAILRYGGSALALFLLLRFLPGRSVLHALASLPARLWLIVLAGYMCAHCIGINKWRLVVNSAGAGLNLRQAAQCYFAGLFASLFLPSLIGGDLVRAALAMRLGRTKTGVLLGSFVDRILDFTALAILAGIGALLAPEALDPRGRRILAVAVGAIALVSVLVLATGAFFLVARASYRMRRRLVRLRRAGRSMARRPRVMLGALGLGIVTQLAFIGLNMALAGACGLHLPLRAWLFAWPLAKFCAAIPITQGGIGVREAALVAFLAPFGAPAALTLAAGLAWDAIVVSGGLLGGAISLFARGKAAVN